ncbi:hypothetical protein BpHYR1_001615 [Brachionus plicatilis]|uniref:Uncharacterized protein n=1 Tax=Brachionus plicatilis TaxID=10195 RepID=A0A3M7QAP9_BRAPC|nr:hypothetical protein BpHYR1_001615 [Brachionus plicatilis]
MFKTRCFKQIFIAYSEKILNYQLVQVFDQIGHICRCSLFDKHTGVSSGSLELIFEIVLNRNRLETVHKGFLACLSAGGSFWMLLLVLKALSKRQSLNMLNLNDLSLMTDSQLDWSRLANISAPCLDFRPNESFIMSEDDP